MNEEERKKFLREVMDALHQAPQVRREYLTIMIHLHDITTTDKLKDHLNDTEKEMLANYQRNLSKPKGPEEEPKRFLRD
jgi:hypothetical protein